MNLKRRSRKPLLILIPLALIVAVVIVQNITSPSVPCRIDPLFLYNLHGPASCLILHGGKALLVREPFRWSFPGGRPKRGEKSQCTAARETFEETGNRVEVGELLFNWDDQFYLFRCRLLDPEIQLRRPLFDKITAVRLLDPLKVPAKSWRNSGKIPRLYPILEKELEEAALATSPR